MTKVAPRDCVVAQTASPLELAFWFENINRKIVNPMRDFRNASMWQCVDIGLDELK